MTAITIGSDSFVFGGLRAINTETASRGSGAKSSPSASVSICLTVAWTRAPQAHTPVAPVLCSQTPPRSPSPRAPPPAVRFFERLRDEETDSDADCELIEYAECLEVVRQFAGRNPGFSTNLRVTTSHCEGLENEAECFLGCAYGDDSGGTYRFLLPEIDSTYTKPRCKLSTHPRCLFQCERTQPTYDVESSTPDHVCGAMGQCADSIPQAGRRGATRRAVRSER